MYDTDGRFASDSEHGRDVYANTLEIFCQIQRHVKKLFYVY